MEEIARVSFLELIPNAHHAMATASKAADTDFRKKWDKEEYAEKARKRDADEKERMQDNEARMKQGTPTHAPWPCSISC